MYKDILDYIASNAHVIGFLGILLIVVPSTIILLLQTLFYLKGRRYVDRVKGTNIDGLISIIVPIRKEPVEILDEGLKHIYSWNIRDHVEVIIVSDDDPEDLPSIRKIVEKWKDKGLNIHFIWRSIPRGFRTGALNVGLYASKGKYVYIMDVDSRVPESYYMKAIEMIKNGYKAVVGRWRGLNKDTRLAEAISVSMDYIVDSIYRGRASLNLPVMPVGTGTLYLRNYLLNELGGWDENRIQDDMEIGTRILRKGGKIGFIDSTSISVEVPRRLKSFRIQQERWAYGATDVVIARFWDIILSDQPLYSKLETILFLLQYLPVLTTFIGALLVIVSLFFGFDAFHRYWFIGLPWIIAMILYGGSYIDSQIRRGKPIYKALVNLGRVTAATTTISITISKAMIKAFLRRPFIYKRTPKGKHETMFSSLRFPTEILFLTLLTVSAIYGLLNGTPYTGGWILFYSLAYYYSIIRWGKDLLFK